MFYIVFGLLILVYSLVLLSTGSIRQRCNESFMPDGSVGWHFDCGGWMIDEVCMHDGLLKEMKWK